MIQPNSLSTPLPLNILDEYFIPFPPVTSEGASLTQFACRDIMEGRSVSHPIATYTPASVLLLNTSIARCIRGTGFRSSSVYSDPLTPPFQAVFDHINTEDTPSYQFLLEQDGIFKTILAALPPWITTDGPTPGLSESAQVTPVSTPAEYVHG